MNGLGQDVPAGRFVPWFENSHKQHDVSSPLWRDTEVPPNNIQ